MDKVQTTIRLPSELKKKLEQKAKQIGISFNAIIVIYLQQVIEEN